MDDPEHPLWKFIRSSNRLWGRRPYSTVPLRISLTSFNAEQALADRAGELKRHALHLLGILEGNLGRFSHAELEQKLKETFTFVSSTSLGATIGELADEVMRSDTHIPAFSASARLAEFVPTAMKWAAVKAAEKPTDWRESLRMEWKGDGIDPVSDEYFFMKALKDSKDSTAFAEEIHGIIQRRKDAKAAKKSPNRCKKPVRKNRFRDRLLSQWMVAALWCRSSSGILKLFNEPELEPDVSALEKDISKLKLILTRKSEHEPQIKIAEDTFWPPLIL